MFRVFVPALLGSLFVAPLSVADASTDPAPLAPKRLVVDSVTAPVLSVDQAAITVDIVLVPDGEYVPVHPDSLDLGDESPALSETSGLEPDDR